MIDTERIEKLRHRFQENENIPILLTDLSNIFYLSGFTGSSAFLIVFPEKKPIFLCDGRYTTQAEEEVGDGADIVGFDYRIFQKIAEIVGDNGYKRIYFETSLSYAHFSLLRETGLDCIPAPAWVEEMRMVKSGQEIEQVEEALHISERAFQKIRDLIRPGIKERDLSLELEYQMEKLGGDDIAFPTIIASGSRSAFPHARPTGATVQSGDWLVLDWGAKYHMYCGDITRTVLVGDGNRSCFNKYFDLVRKAQILAQESIRDGMLASQVDRQARQYLEENKVAQHFTHGLGHGVGIQIHEAPRLGPAGDVILKEGMVVTVEPGIYFPGQGGIRLENMVVVGKDSCRILNSLSETA
ncbi:MAG: Xaa-Pro peptidase family protein [Candidatus Atribacteria bacterium]|nr:Xaa-Pro peptidase family protein [Candidatus Atribacteria bacterium]